jgi:hypothetical protein
MLLRIQSVRIESAFLRARCALAAAVADGDKEAMLADAEQMARRIEKELMMWGDPIAKLIRANASWIRGESEPAISLLGSAAVEFEAADMALLAMVARRCLGELVGGDEGNTEVSGAKEWMTRQNIRAPERMTSMYAPGLILSD